MKRESFIFYHSYAEALQTLSDKQRLHLFDAIIAYSLDGADITLTGVEKGMFALIRPQIDANNQKYENGCKGAEYGKHGGRPHKDKSCENPKGVNSENPSGVKKKNPKKTPNDNENENENDNDNDNDNENDNENENENDDDDNCARAQTSSSTVVNNDIELFNALDASGLFTDKEIQQIIDAFSCSTWLRKNITSPQKIAKLKSKIISGYYRDYAETNNDKSQGIITAQMDCSKYEAMGFQIITDDD